MEKGKSNREIASLLGKTSQTIHTEIKRGTVLQGVGIGRFKEAYSADYAQQSYESAGIKKSSHITQGNRYIKQALTISGLIAAHSNTLQKSNSNHVSFVLPYSSTACGSRFLVCSLIFIEYKDPAFSSFYNRISQRGSKMKAVIACAHNILRIIYKLLSTKQTYQKEKALGLRKQV